MKLVRRNAARCSQFHGLFRSLRLFLWAATLVFGLWGLTSLRLSPHTALAQTAAPQANLKSYTVQSGDTLSALATRFGVSLDALVAINHIADPSVLEIGQVLLIPSDDATLGAVATTLVQARPGETLAMLAARYAQAPDLLATLNGISETHRLFPGESIRLPAEHAPGPPLYFGAVRQIDVPTQLEQGHTGHVKVETTHSLALTGSWAGLPIAFAPADEQHPQQQWAFLPTPALLDPGAYTLAITYTASNGIALVHQQLLNVVAGDYEHQDIDIPSEKVDLLDPTLATSETLKVSAVWSQISPQFWCTGPFTRPISAEYPTTSPFGTRRVYNEGALVGFHSGQDFGAPEGVTVTVPATGVIALAEPLGVRGNAVLIDHGRGVFTGYWHFSKILVHVGQHVVPGNVLGLVGTTGLSTGAHLHWELRIYGVAVNPLQFLDEPLGPP